MKNSHIQADWSKWVDDDEEDEAKPLGDDWNEDNMNAFGGGGMGGMQGGDSDDEEEEEEEHVHGDHCSHGHGVGAAEEEEAAPERKNADLGDLDKEEEAQ